MAELSSMAPWIHEDCRFLILGSMPGRISLEKAAYYAHPRNAFWPLLYDLFEGREGGEGEGSLSKRALLAKYQLGLWDVLASCQRKGSLDSAIRQGQVQDFTAFYARYPGIEAVFFNGKKAYQDYRKSQDMSEGREYISLPSTSPAYTISYQEKRRAWSTLSDYIFAR